MRPRKRGTTMPEAQVFPPVSAAFAHGRALGSGFRLCRPESAARGSAGALLGKRPGSSVEFMDHRDYHLGDDIRRIDWAAYGRSDRLSVRLYREENAPRLDLVVDVTRSMDLPETGKAATTAAWAGMLLEAALGAGFTPMLWLAEPSGLRPVPSSRIGAWAQMLNFSAVGHPGITDRAARFAPGSVRVLISDLLWPVAPELVARHLVTGAASTCVIQVMAQAEVAPPKLGATRLLDRESGLEQQIFVDARIAKAYADNLAAHREAWGTACRARGAQLIETTEADCFPVFNSEAFLRARLIEPR